ncbi:DUF724 domain-containing protein 6-like [Rutidosis leptorrhynchoides]|uniref:DUF724 domain-containing protein 6-like n=1 Tax=Rutidosis leptorrhynchoides TaxID=125765 RepID=UPI003A9941FC
MQSSSTGFRESTFLKKGARVEFLPNEEGFKGSYFTVTIVEMPEDDEIFVVEYDTLMEDDEKKPLQEEADFSRLRPLPPLTGSGNNQRSAFELNEIVDAFHMDGWWVGVIDKIVNDGEGGKKYRVRFDYSAERIVFPISDLRPHFDWVDGKWETSSANNSSGKSKVENVATGTVLAVEKKSERRQCLKSSRKGLVEKVPIDMVTPTKRQHQHEKLTPTPCSKKFKIVCRATGRTASTEKSPAATTALENEGAFSLPKKIPDLMQFCNFDSTIRKKKRAHKTKRAGQALSGNYGSKEDMNVVEYCASNKQPELESSFPLTSEASQFENEHDKEHNNGVGPNDKAAASESTATEAGLPETGKVEEPSPISPLCENMTLHSGGNEDANGEACPFIKGPDLKSITAEKMITFELQDKELNDGVRAADEISGNDWATADARLPEIGEPEPTNMTLHSGKKCIAGVGATDKVEFFSTSKEIEAVMANPTLDTCPLDIYRTELCSTTKESENAGLEAPIETLGTSVQDLHPRLPFVKSLLVWKMMESLEVFQKTPQKPHFQPLHNELVVEREGLALACFATFNNVVQMISNLRYDDPETKFEETLQALSGLERHGFDVEPLHKRINRLLASKAKIMLLQIQVDEAQVQVKEKAGLKTFREEELAELAKKIDQMAKKLVEAKDHEARVKSMKVHEDAEFAVMKSTLATVSGELEAAHNEVQKLASEK